MSHSNVLVIGDDPEKQLEPFDEGLKVEPYKVYLEPREIEFMQKRFQATTTELGPHIEEVFPLPGGVDPDGRVWRWSTYNPKSRWDYYVLGGRWCGSFRLKNGTTTDQARKGEIDWEGIKVTARQAAAEEWDMFWADPQLSADEMMARIVLGIEPGTTREQFIDDSDKWVMHAVLKDGEWYERGRMAMWGITISPKSPEDWEAQFTALLDSLPDDTLLSVYDVHI